MMRKPLSFWEDLAVTDLQEASIDALSGFQIESLSNQVDWEKDQLNRAVPHIIIAATRVAHLNGGFPTQDPVTLTFVAVVPGGLQYERRQRAMDALTGIADWMRMNELAMCSYQPSETMLERMHPLAVATLTVLRVG